MKIRHARSQVGRKCLVCNTYTEGRKVYEEGGISIHLAICNREDSNCQSKVVIKNDAVLILRNLRHKIKDILEVV